MHDLVLLCDWQTSDVQSRSRRVKNITIVDLIAALGKSARTRQSLITLPDDVVKEGGIFPEE